MPEMVFRVRWPDRTATDCYSPSLVIRDYFVPGKSYSVPDFLARSRTALRVASERVRAKYGYGCGHAARQLEELEQIAARFGSDSEAQVEVEAFLPVSGEPA